MKYLYEYDPETKAFTHQIFEVENDQSIENTTDIKPEDGLYEPIIFDGKKWSGITQEEFIEQNPPEPQEPTDQVEIIANLTKQTAKATQAANLAQKATAELTKQVATLKGEK